MRFTWDDRKRLENIRKHALDFAEAEIVFRGLTYTIEDTRFDYSEQRFATLGLLGTTVVVIAHTEVGHEVRVISMRKATRREQAIYFNSIQED
jgi:uncharacterized protein